MRFCCRVPLYISKSVPGCLIFLVTVWFGVIEVLCCQQSTLNTSQPESSQTSAPGISVFKMSVRSVVVDAVVTDARGNPVSGLTRNDFHLFEDGVAQQIRTFDPHVNEAQPLTVPPALPPNTFSNLSLAPASGPISVILYDLLNTPARCPGLLARAVAEVPEASRCLWTNGYLRS